MLANFDSIHQEEQQTLVLKGTYNEKIDAEKPIIFFQERVSKEDYFSPQRIDTDVKWNGQEFTFSLKLQNWKNKLAQNQIWDCYIAHGEQTEKIQADFSEHPGKKHSPHLFYTAKPYITKMQSFAISVKAKKLSAAVTNTQIDQQHVTFGFSISETFFKTITNTKQAVELKLTFKKRIQADLNDYQHEKTFPVTQTDQQTYTSSVDLNTFVAGETLAPVTKWDLFVTVKNKSGQTVAERLDIDPEYDIFKQTFDLSSVFSASFQHDKNAASLAVFTETEPATVHHLKVDNQRVMLKGNVHDFQIDGADLQKESTVNNAELTAMVMKLPVTEQDGTFNVTLPMDELAQNYHLDDKDEFFINMKFRDKKAKVTMNVPVYLDTSVNVSKKPIRVTNNYQIRLLRGPANKLQFRSRTRTQEPEAHSLRIATCGSCFSRLGFGSKDYFNPDYKNKYEVVYTQFHSSVISMMGKPVKFPGEKFTDLHPTLADRVRSDFEKDFFTNIKRTKPDFFILDFYVDGSKDVLFFDKKHMITANYMLTQSVNYMHEIEPYVSVLSQKDIAAYLEHWHKAVQKFCKKLVKYIPEERIILQKVRKAEGYYAKNGEFHEFNNQTYIQRSNYLFEYMENYFLNLLPNVQVIDLSDQGFQSHYKHPSSITPDHFESDYYKAYMNRLDDLVLRYFIQHPAYLKKRKKKGETL
ncbi:DUF6270 domain-containing protein [Virgibacillus ihumii]|uniref:DUF6270 domain-containing protein n=1 Tax=Virgibacillus ihumii TaxID=2686091 RepID=UPI00157BC3FA|nr:DUF6270 domain-containing protein [Virgibacillus ihumii]